MAHEAVWVPQTPKTPRVPMQASHARSASVGWRSKNPFVRKREESVAGPTANLSIAEDQESTGREPMPGAWRSNFSFTKKRTDNVLDSNGEDTEPTSRDNAAGPWRSNAIFGKMRSTSAPDQPEEQEQSTKDIVVGSISSGVGSISHGVGSIGHGLRKKGVKAFKRANTELDVSAYRRATTALPTPTFPPADMQENSFPTMDDIPISQGSRTANVRKSRSFNDLKSQQQLQQLQDQDVETTSVDRWESREIPGSAHSSSVSSNPYTPRSVNSSPKPVSRKPVASPATSPAPIARRPVGSPATSPAPTTRRPVNRNPSIKSPPSAPSTSWQQDTGLQVRHGRNDSTLSVIVEHKAPSPPKSPPPLPPLPKEEENDEEGSKKTGSPTEHVDGVDFEMVTHESTSQEQELASSPEPADDGAEDVADENTTSPAATDVMSPEMMSLIQFPAPPPIPFASPKGGHRWTMVSNPRASSILLPDTYEQPATPHRSAHRRASSENDTGTIQVTNKDGFMCTLPETPPTPPPKEDYQSKSSTEMDRQGSTSSTESSNPAPPACPKGTLPTPRSKFNYTQTPQSRSRASSPKAASESPKPPVPASAGARIAAAAARAPSPATIPATANASTSVSLKASPPSRPPPPPPPPPGEDQDSRGTSPNRAPSTSSALKRRSSTPDKRKKEQFARLERTKSQMRRDLAKKMALDNIGAVKIRDPAKSPGKPKKMEHKLNSKPSIHRLETTAAPEKPKGVSRKPSVKWSQAQESEVQKIGSLNGELKRLEEQMAEARRHQKALNEARQRLQDPNKAASSTPPQALNDEVFSSDEIAAQSTGSGHEVVLAQLDKKIEKWRKEMEQAEHKRNRIKKKLAWHSADRLKLVSPKSGMAAKSLPRRPASMFSPSSVYSEDKLSAAAEPMPSIDALAILNPLPPAPLMGRSASQGNHVLAEDNGSRSPTPALDASIENRPSIDDTDGSHPPTPKFEATPMAANEPWLDLDNPFMGASANEPWLGLENPYVDAATMDADSIKSPASIGASPGRQTIQLFAGEDIMAEVARGAAAAQVTGGDTLAQAPAKADGTDPYSPPPRMDRKMTIQVFAESGIADLVSALQEEIENIGKEEQAV